MNPEKICPKHNDGAGALLPASDFYVITNRQGKPALAGYCKECSKNIAKSYHKQHPEKARAAVIASLARHPETASKKYPSQLNWAREDKKANPEKWISKHRKHGWKKNFGITPEWYHAKLAEQGGHCALCPNTVSSTGRWLGVDHCHVTEQLRGILCDRCNSCLERMEMDGWHERALAYLAFYRDHPEKIYTPHRIASPHETHPRTALHN